MKRSGSVRSAIWICPLAPVSPVVPRAAECARHGVGERRTEPAAAFELLPGSGEFVQDAFVLENLINQLAATFLRRDQGAADSGNQEKTPAQEPKK